MNFYIQCKNIIKKLRECKNSWPFRKPVDQKEVPDYFEVITEPMDIQTLENNLESGCYKNKEIFVKDLRKIFNNAKQYNKPHTIYHKYAKDLEHTVEDDIQNLKEN